MKKLYKVLQFKLNDSNNDDKTESTNFLSLFIAAKRVEGCSNETTRYYQSTLEGALDNVGKEIKKITTDDLRQYLDSYQQSGSVSKVTIDNIRQILSSFFSWLGEEEYIIKNPMKRIYKVKTGKSVKETYSDEALEIMRDGCESVRDLEIIDLLASTGMRVGELVNLDKSDIDFENRECVVFGKGEHWQLW